jgi:hypothetical protein
MHACLQKALLIGPALVNGTMRDVTAAERVTSILLMQLSGLFHMLAHKLAPSVVKAPWMLSAMLRNVDLPYSKMLRTLQLQAVLVMCTAVAIVSGLGAGVFRVLQLVAQAAMSAMA